MIDALTVLKSGADRLGLSLNDAQFEQLLGYLALIQKWNKVYNLTAVRDPQEMLTHHLLDSLTAVAPLLRHTQGQPARVLDVGSGGGLPKFPNLRGIHAPVETLGGPFDVICCRAFASLPDFVSWSRAALAPAGVWMAMKGKHPQAEIDALPADVQVFHVEPLAVPGLDVERCMVWLKVVG